MKLIPSKPPKNGKQSIVVIGLGRFGFNLAKTLVNSQQSVLAVEKNPGVIDKYHHILPNLVQADSTNEAVLRDLGIPNFDTVVIAIGNDEKANIITAMLVKELGVKNVISKAKSTIHGKILEKIGVDRVIYPEKEMGIRTAHLVLSKTLVDYMDIDPGLNIVELHAPKCWHGLSLENINVRTNYGSTVIAIKHDQDLITIPPNNYLLQPEDIIIIIGKRDSNQRIQNLL